MSNPSDRQPPEREVHTDADGNIHTRETGHRDGYINGRETEERFFVNQRVRSGPGPGLLIGIALASLLGVGIIVWYLLSQTSNEPVQQIIVPENEAPTAPQSPASSPPDVNITVPSAEVPQAPQTPSSPDVNITIPSVEVPQAPQAPSSSPQNNSDTTAPSSQPDTTNTTPTSPSNSSTTNPTNNSTTNSTDSTTNSTDSTNSGQDQQ